ncbi:four helix bundle protein [Patescibacteria group bacterium]|nr:four helix bundle protein [Patescibacteria group bacterium]
MPQEGVVQEKSFNFAEKIVHFCRYLQKKREYVISRQLLKSGTSIGANIEEAQFAESKKDFIHKMHISLKEARETRYWLRLILRSGTSKEKIVQDLLNESNELISLLTAIIKSSKKR